VKNLNSIRKLIEEEIKPVIGCTEPASIAFAFSVARRNLKYGLSKDFSALVYLSKDVYRNASTVFVPGVRKIGIEFAVASGILTSYDKFNPFKENVKKLKDISELASKSNWLKIVKLNKRGIFVRAVLKTEKENVSVFIKDKHNYVKSITRNGKLIFKNTVKKLYHIRSLKEIFEIVNLKDKKLEETVKHFMLEQSKNIERKFKSGIMAVYRLIEERMLGSSKEIITITGSGNQGIFLFVPYYFLYKKYKDRILPALLFSILTQIYLAERKERISSLCGLANKSAPSLISGLAYFSGKDLEDIIKMMNLTEETLRGLKCEGAKRSCALKGYISLLTVKRILSEFKCYEKV